MSIPTIKAVRIGNLAGDGTRLVTLDVGWGTATYRVAADGSAERAGFGEQVYRDDDDGAV